MLHTQLTSALQGRPSLCESKLNAPKETKEEKNHKTLEMRPDNGNTYSWRPATHGRWASRSRVAGFTSQPLHQSSTQPPNEVWTALGFQGSSFAKTRTKMQTFAFTSQLARKLYWKVPIKSFASAAMSFFYEFMCAGMQKTLLLSKNKHRYTNQPKPKTASISHPAASTHVTYEEIML